ncbi:MAG: hypothetical protein ABI185_04390 [Ginsengibacter sp.]
MNKFKYYLSIFFCCSAATVFSQNQIISNSEKRELPFEIKSQPRFYVNVHAGANMALGSTFKFYPDDITSIKVKQTVNNTEQENVTSKAPSKGLGDGFRYGVGMSYIINDFINVGLDVDYFSSTISKIKDSSFTHINEGGATDYVYHQSYAISYQASLLTITPNIIFKAISHPKYFIYNKIGAVLTIRPNSIQKETQNISEQRNGMNLSDSSATINRRYDWGIKNPAFGFMGGIGIQAKVKEKILVFAEVQFSHIQFQTKSRTLTDYDVNGDPKINTLPLSERQVIFEKDLSTNNFNSNSNDPSRAIIQKFPVTYVGFQAGVSYHF